MLLPRSTNFHSSQQLLNTFVLVMYHMKRGNTLCRKCHILQTIEALQIAALDAEIEYITIIPLRSTNCTAAGKEIELQ
jgi:hypothetical protein